MAGVKLAGILSESMGYPIEDPAVMMAAVWVHIVATCETHHVPAVGSVVLQMTETWPGLVPHDVALRWEFTPVSRALGRLG